MKAVWLLFCLGLAHGSIFRGHHLSQIERFAQRPESIETYERRQEYTPLVRHNIAVDPTPEVSNEQSNLERVRYTNEEYYPSARYADKQHASMKKQSRSREESKSRQDSRYNHDQTYQRSNQDQIYQRPGQAYRSNQEQTYQEPRQVYRSNKASSSSEEDLVQFRYANGEYYPIPQYADQEKSFYISKKLSNPTQVGLPYDKDLEQFRFVKGVYYAIPKYADQQPYSSKSQVRSKPTETFGDAVEWRGIKIAVGPQDKVEKKDIEDIYYEAQKSMKHPDEATRQKYHEMYEKVSQKKSEDVSLNATELLKKYEYPVEEHVVRTDDGYYLTLFRIVKETPRNEDVTPRPVVLLMHSMLGSADEWLLMGPHKSLAYLLADQGYDVWLGNARGSKYSRRHVSLHPAQDDFWRYSNDEIALHDLPAMIDYALTTSAQQKLFYVGYDLGTTAYFALASTRPEYNDKVAMMYALSPMAYMSHVRSPLVKMIAPNSPFYEKLDQYLRDGEFKPSKELVSTMGGEMLENEIGCEKIASNVYFVMSGMNVENVDVDLIRVIMEHMPAGGSTRQVKQYGQAAATHDYRMYDYGSEINKEVYGELVPPAYDVTKISTPVALYYSKDDWLAHPRDVLKLKEQLPNLREYNEVPEEYFSHMDFVYSTMAPEVVYKKLIESIKTNINKN